MTYFTYTPKIYCYQNYTTGNQTLKQLRFPSPLNASEVSGVTQIDRSGFTVNAYIPIYYVGNDGSVTRYLDTYSEMTQLVIGSGGT